MADALPTVVLDNGGGSLKAGFAGEARPRAVIPNAVGRAKRGGGLFAGDDAETLVRDPSQLTWLRPAERGVTNDPLVQSLVWERALGGAHLNVPYAGGHALLLSSPAFVPAPLEVRGGGRGGAAAAGAGYGSGRRGGRHSEQGGSVSRVTGPPASHRTRTSPSPTIPPTNPTCPPSNPPSPPRRPRWTSWCLSSSALAR
jgi:hypothetical protein